MKRLYIFTMIMISCLSASANVYKEEILDIVKNALNNGNNEIWVSNQQYALGDTIFLWDGYITCPFENAWCAFVDYHPLQNWGHECAYFFVNTSNRDYVKMSKSLPPKDISRDWTKYETCHQEGMHDNSYASLQTILTNNTRNNRTMESSEISEDPNLYAIIIDYCGYSSEYNYERFWNNCAAIFTSLKENGYMQEHIFVAMPNGSADMPTLHLCSGNYIPSPTDLNGDNIQDVRYAPTIGGVDTLFRDISNLLTVSDRLLIYITGHGDHPLDYSLNYFGSLVDGNYYDSRFIDKILALRAGIINVIVERNATYYLRTQTHRIHSATSFLSVVSYDDVEHTSSSLIDNYTLRWAQAVNNMGDVGVDLNGDGEVSIYEAHLYAIDGNNEQYYRPYQESHPVCLAHDLTISNTLPSDPCLQSDLYIKDNDEDDGFVPNASTDLAYISPDIWIEDMQGNVAHTLISNEPYKVCVRIRNRGYEDSPGGEQLHVHWTKAVIGGKWPNSWIDNNYFDCNGTSVIAGAEITPSTGIELPIIDAMDDYVARIPWIAPNSNYYSVCSEFDGNIDELWHYCLLVRLYENDEQPGADLEYQPLGPFILNSNNVASKNITIMSENATNHTMTSIVGVVAPYNGTFSLVGELYCYPQYLLEEDMTIKLYLDNNLLGNWSIYGDGIGFVDMGQYLQITNPTAEIRNITFDENLIYTIKVEIENYSGPYFMYDITLQDENGNILGGERFTHTEGQNMYHSPSMPNSYNYSTSEELSLTKHILVINALGQIISQWDNTENIDIMNLPHGVYSVIIETEEKTIVHKIIK